MRVTESCKPSEVMISIVQNRMPMNDMNVRSLLRMRLRTIILALNDRRFHSGVTRSSRMRLPSLGGLGRSSEAVVSFAALR